VLASEGVQGHYGLRGMPERAALMGGTLAVWSEVSVGTELELRSGRRRLCGAPAPLLDVTAVRLPDGVAIQTRRVVSPEGTVTGRV
jgi:hypothetical protein